jgi:hypothetical protein
MEQLIKMRSEGATFQAIAKAMGKAQGSVQHRFNTLRCDTRKMIETKCYKVRADRASQRKKQRAMERDRLREEAAKKKAVSYDEWGRGPLALCGRVKAEKLITRIFAGELTERQAQEMAR